MRIKIFILLFLFLSCTASHQYYNFEYNKRKTGDALEFFKLEKLKYPKNPEIYYYLALCHLKIGIKEDKVDFYSKAIEELQTSYNLERKNKTAIALLFSYEKYAEKLTNMKKKEEAIKIYKKYVALSSKLLYKHNVFKSEMENFRLRH